MSKLCDLLSLGMYEEPALEAVGIARRTYYRWKAEGEAASRLAAAMAEEGKPAPRLTALQQRQRVLWEALCRATGGFEAAYLRIIAQAATGGAKSIEVHRTIEHVRTTRPDGTIKVESRVVGEMHKERTLVPDWKAALEVLSRRAPNRWARTERVEMTGRDGNPTESQVNVGDMAVNDPVVSAAVDRLLDEVLGNQHEDSQ